MNEDLMTLLNTIADVLVIFMLQLVGRKPHDIVTALQLVGRKPHDVVTALQLVGS